MYKYQSYAERQFANCVVRSRFGNKKRRKAKVRGGELVFSCGCYCCESWRDKRRAMLDEIHRDEINYWRECL